MDLIAGEKDVSFVIGTGDNFYDPDGILGVDDPRWHKDWADIYQTKDYLKDLTWYGCLGNHDYNTQHMDAFFDFKQHGWRIDGHVWSHTHTLINDDVVAFVHIDTNFLTYGEDGEDSKNPGMTDNFAKYNMTDDWMLY